MCGFRNLNATSLKTLKEQGIEKLHTYLLLAELNPQKEAAMPESFGVAFF